MSKGTTLKAFHWGDGKKPKPVEEDLPKPKCNHVKTCVYRMKMEGCGSFCNYIVETGHRRGCPPERCDKYKPKKKGTKNDG